MTKLADKLYNMARHTKSGVIYNTQYLTSLLLEAADTISREEVPPDAEAPQFTGYELDGNVVGACVSSSGDVVINDGDGSVIFNCFEVDILIKALKYLRPMMGKSE